MKYYAFAGAVIVVGLAACGGPGSYAEKEEFQGDARYRRDFSVAAAPLCAAARRVLMGDGYALGGASGNALLGVKQFQVEKERHAVLQVRIVCEPRAGGASLFMTATEAHFDVGIRRKRTTIGIPIVAPIAVTSKSEIGEQVKTRGETVSDGKFYERFYRAVRKELVG